MSHFAEVDEQNTVLRVIVAEQDFVDTLPGRWIQCSYNTRGGVNASGGLALRKNFPGCGWFYDEAEDGFHPPKPFDSWNLDKNTFLWEPPIPAPTDGKYWWDESSLAWVANG